MKNILVLCTGNSCRSQMAHGYLDHFGAGKYNVFSAGIEVHGLNPLAVHVMKEDGVDISKQTSNHVEEYLPHVAFDFVLTVCDHANEHCPVIPGKYERVHHTFTDPSRVIGNYNEILQAFRDCRDAMKDFAKKLAENL